LPDEYKRAERSSGHSKVNGLKGEENFKGLDSKRIKITKNIRLMQACAQK
jgi:hypothetical protein